MAKITIFDAPSSAQELHAVYERVAEDWRRDHLGASVLGHECDRYLWLTFRWAQDPKHSGRMLRLFSRGDREEAWVVEDLRRAGFEVVDKDPDTGEQFAVRWGHVGGHMDGTVKGLIEAPKTEHVLEVKTHNRKSFERLVELGVKRAKPEHFIQMQVYMRGSGLTRAYYVAVCKDDDQIHAERVNLDAKVADEAIARAQAVVAAQLPAAKLDKEQPPCVLTSKDGTRWPCQFFDVCHGSAMPPKSCRTCISSEPWSDGLWVCVFHKRMLGAAMQREGCPGHVTIPAMVNAQVAEVDVEKRQVVYQFADGARVTDGGVP